MYADTIAALAAAAQRDIRAELGLRPIIVLRDSNGKLRALYNRCTHRGTTLCRLERSN